MSADLARRIAFTLGALILYRFGTYIPLPGIDPIVLEQVFRSQSVGILRTADGGIHRLSIFALDIWLYVNSAILIQLVILLFGTRKRLDARGERGRRAIEHTTLLITALSVIMESLNNASALEQFNQVSEPGWLFRISTVATRTGSTFFLIWLSRQITLRGVGNGLALILFTGIVAEVPGAIAGTVELGRQGALSVELIVVVLVVAVAVIACIVLMELARRHVPVEYAGRQIGNRMFEGQSSHLPLKLNTSGVIPPVFASPLLLLPTTVANFQGGQVPDWLAWFMAQFAHGRPLFLIYYALLIIILARVYRALLLVPAEMAERLKRFGGSIPGVESGDAAAERIDFILSRISFFGAIYLAVICLIPEMLIAYAAVPFYFGGTSLLLVVGVVLDINAQLRPDGIVNKLGG